jgi:hypothetical protein
MKTMRGLRLNDTDRVRSRAVTHPQPPQPQHPRTAFTTEEVRVERCCNIVRENGGQELQFTDQKVYVRESSHPGQSVSRETTRSRKYHTCHAQFPASRYPTLLASSPTPELQRLNPGSLGNYTSWSMCFLRRGFYETRRCAN